METLSLQRRQFTGNELNSHLPISHQINFDGMKRMEDKMIKSSFHNFISRLMIFNYFVKTSP